MSLDYKKIINGKFSWLVTGAAGFIGSHLCETLIKADQIVIGLDNLSTGNIENIEDIKSSVSSSQKSNFTFINGDICDYQCCIESIKYADYCLHQAALGSVPKSIEDPIEWNRVNVEGTVKIFTAAKDSKKLKGLTYASSSSVYGDSMELPKVENKIGLPLSPYAASKNADELYAQAFWSCYQFPTVGFRYFNVFGSRQDPNGAYAAVIPKWLMDMAKGVPCVINGDGKTSRDFCFIDNVVQANILGALKISSLGNARMYNVGVGETTTLLELHGLLATEVERITGKKVLPHKHADFRAGDVRFSLADVTNLNQDLGVRATHTIRQGLGECVGWYLEKYDCG